MRVSLCPDDSGAHGFTAPGRPAGRKIFPSYSRPTVRDGIVLWRRTPRRSGAYPPRPTWFEKDRNHVRADQSDDIVGGGRRYYSGKRSFLPNIIFLWLIDNINTTVGNDFHRSHNLHI